MNLIDYHVSRGWGVIAGPQGLGIVVGDDPRRCPTGWLFVNVAGYSPEIGRAALDALHSGRAGFPDVVFEDHSTRRPR